MSIISSEQKAKLRANNRALVIKLLALRCWLIEFSRGRTTFGPS